MSRPMINDRTPKHTERQTEITTNCNIYIFMINEIKDIDDEDIADISGMEVAADGLHLAENRWLALKKEDGSAKSKIGKGISSIQNQLSEVEKFVNWYSKIKNENGVKRDDYYKRTNKSLHKIKERLMNLSEKIRTL